MQEEVAKEMKVKVDEYPGPVRVQRGFPMLLVRLDQL